MARAKKIIPTDDLSVQEFKERVIEYFQERNIEVLYGRLSRLTAESVTMNQDRIDETTKKIRDIEAGKVSPITIPGLALHLNWSVNRLVEYSPEGKFSSPISYAKTKCESFLLDSMFSGKIDKTMANMMLIKYFGYGEGKQNRSRSSGGEQRRQSISEIIDGMEAEVATHNAKRKNSKSK